MVDETRHERYDIPNADVLDEDVWAEGTTPIAPDKCPECGAALDGEVRCPACGALAPMCTGMCGACSITPCTGRSEGGK